MTAEIHEPSIASLTSLAALLKGRLVSLVRRADEDMVLPSLELEDDWYGIIEGLRLVRSVSRLGMELSPSAATLDGGGRGVRGREGRRKLLCGDRRPCA